MRTIIIAEKTLIDDINNNPVFFEPFKSCNDVLFCKWDPKETSVANAVPELKHCVDKCSDWRAVIICDESSLNPAKRNPFDTVEYRDEDRNEELSDLEYIQQCQKSRFKAFENAATQPLTKLVTLLCESPEIGDGILWSQSSSDEGDNKTTDRESSEGSELTDEVNHNVSDSGKRNVEAGAEKIAGENKEIGISDPGHKINGVSPENTDVESIDNKRRSEWIELEEYRQEAIKKQELRKDILKDVSEHFIKPSQVICIAKRDYEDDRDFLHSTWTAHTELQYSNFYNYNLYFDKMRYLIYDISSRKTESEHLSNFKFEYALMLIACNPLPEDCLHPNRVYMAECLYDQQALGQMLTQYYVKLTGTAQKIEKDVKALYGTEKKEISDQDAESLFHSHITIPVTMPSNIDSNALFADYKGLGLSSDCPTDELAKWNSEKGRTTDALMRYLKQPRRSIKKAAKDMRALTNLNTKDATLLNEFQMNDLEEVMENQEIEMVSSYIPNVFNTENYRQRLEDSSDEVKNKTKTRMSRNCTIGVAVCVLALFLIGLLPMWLGSLSEPLVIPGALIMIGVALVLLALTGFVCLFFLRHALIQKWKAYNQVMHEISSDIDNAMAQASEYISLVCRFMQEHAALMLAKYQELPQKSKCRIMEKHLTDIYNQREYICNTFGELVHTCEPEENTKIYDYDFLRTCTYKYPLPVESDEKSVVTFMEENNTVQVPYRFMESLTVRRVEIYD